MIFIDCRQRFIISLVIANSAEVIKRQKKVDIRFDEEAFNTRRSTQTDYYQW
jgi:hypothetical protein